MPGSHAATRVQSERRAGLKNFASTTGMATQTEAHSSNEGFRDDFHGGATAKGDGLGKCRKGSFSKGDQCYTFNMADGDVHLGEFGKGHSKQFGKGKFGNNGAFGKSEEGPTKMGGCHAYGDSNATVGVGQGCVIGKGGVDSQSEGAMSRTSRFTRKPESISKEHDAADDAKSLNGPRKSDSQSDGDRGSRTHRVATLHHYEGPSGNTRNGQHDDGLEREDDESTDLLLHDRHRGNGLNTRTCSPTLLTTFGRQSDAAPMQRNSKRASITRPSRSRPPSSPCDKEAVFGRLCVSGEFTPKSLQRPSATLHFSPR
eukprot:TRINITY_DN8480_c0_g2_i1.p1 TRINITY_DN8480_c0_g2~~TRINITY_DN8480_c0_g2_i1.p1  ORF type:complete len:314 (+),score=23.56 TRINITY_DN8480_c0_g2_i1:286-1227(+)